MPLDVVELSFEEFESRALADCEAGWARVTDPDGDPPPTLYAYRDARSPATMHSFALPPEALGSRAGKGRVVLLVRTVVAMGAHWVALAYVGMRAKGHEWSPEDVLEMNRTQRFPEWWMQGAADLTELQKDRPDRVAEEAYVMAISEDAAHSNKRDVRRAMAQPPALLGEWRCTAGEHRGLLAEPLVDAVQNRNTEGVEELLRNSGVLRQMGVEL